jgi:hypothetical protein
MVQEEFMGFRSSVALFSGLRQCRVATVTVPHPQD